MGCGVFHRSPSLPLFSPRPAHVMRNTSADHLGFTEQILRVRSPFGHTRGVRLPEVNRTAEGRSEILMKLWREAYAPRESSRCVPTHKRTAESTRNHAT